MSDYSQATAELIERQCRNVERRDFELDKETSQEAILKTYDLFNLKRPSKVVWCVDIFDDAYQNSAGSARSARSAWSARSARSAGSAWSAWSARSAGSAWSARSARSAGSAWSAWSARSARSAGSARSARSAWWSALDYDFSWYVFEFEYCQNPTDKAPNDNDLKYLEYCELLMQAKEAGAGYRVEYDDTLYIAPTPIVRIDNQNRFHSEDEPAIRWKGGREFYFLRGESFDKDLWGKITSHTITAAEVMKITDVDKRTIAISMLSPQEMLKQLNATLVDTGKKDTKLYRCDNFMATGDTEYCMVMKDHSTPREFIEFVPPEVGEKGSADLAQATAMGLTVDEYLSIELEA